MAERSRSIPLGELGEYIEHRKEYKARMCERQRYAIMKLDVPFIKRRAQN